MRTHKFDGWLLARLAAQNLSRRRLRVFLLALSVAMAVGVGLASLVLGWSIRDGISTDFSRMGADMIVVPRDTLVNITSSLLTVQPTDESMEAALAGKLAKIPGVERVAPQRLVSAMVEGQQYKLIAFDPRVDFTVGSWQASHGSGVLPATALLAGGSLAGQTGETLSVCGQPMRIYGRLSKTGVGPFDESYFVTFDALDRLARTTFRTKKPSLTKGSKHVHTASMAAMTVQPEDGLDCLPGYAAGPRHGIPIAALTQCKTRRGQVRDLSVSWAEDRGGKQRPDFVATTIAHPFLRHRCFHHAVACGAADTSSADVLRYRTRTISRSGSAACNGRETRPSHVDDSGRGRDDYRNRGSRRAGLRYDSIVHLRALPGVLLRFVGSAVPVAASEFPALLRSFSSPVLLRPGFGGGASSGMEGPPGRAIPVNSVRRPIAWFLPLKGS